MSKIARIVLFGPESTGKSRLAEQLSAHFAEPCSREYVRQFWDEHDGRITAGDLDAIARGQLDGELRAEAAARRVVFHDTDLLSCRLWDELLFPNACPAWVREQGNARAQSAARYLFCETDIPWEPDPQRCFPDEAGRARCRRFFWDALTALSITPVRITGLGAARLDRAIRAVEETLRTQGISQGASEKR